MVDKRAQTHPAEPVAGLLSPAGRYNPSHHSEVVRAELDEPLGHVRLLDIVPAHSLTTRDTEFLKKRR